MDAYDRLIAEFRAISAGEPSPVANLANAAALLSHTLPELNWAGFYMMESGGALVLGPFQGKPACVRIAPGRGVCGEAVRRGEAILVPDVRRFPGHIACDGASRSELVAPIRAGGRIVGVIDLDSPRVDRFTESDRAGLVRLAEAIAEGLAGTLGNFGAADRRGGGAMLKDFTAERFDILIHAGQSNAEGCGLGPAKNPFAPCEEIWAMSADLTISKAAEAVSGNEIVGNFAYPFARRYVEAGLLGEGRKLLVLRAAVGGTGFSDRRWGAGDDLRLNLIKMIEAAAELNPENRFVALLWHQGETDAVWLSDFETHAKNLRSLIRAVREAARGGGSLPFVMGDFVHHWKAENAAICEPVVRAIRAVCEADPRGAFVETGGLASNREAVGNEDTIHFGRDALCELGDRYFEAFRRL